MDFKLTEPQEALRAKAREFAEKELAPSATERDTKEEFSKELFQRIGQAGLAGVPFPERYGGAGLDLLSFCIVSEELSRVDGCWGLILPSHTTLASLAIYQNGSEEQKQKYLVPLAKGEWLGCYSITEPGAGSDAAALTTTAKLDGDSYVINGRKIFATNAGDGEVYVLFAKTDPEAGARGVSAFIIERDKAPGMSFGAKPSKLGVRSSVQREILLENCRVPKENLIAQEGAGFRIALMALDLGRIAIGAQAVGIAQGAYEAALHHAKTRTAFGQPLTAQQSIAFMLAEMYTEIEAARLIAYKAATLADQGQRVTTEAAMAKRFGADTAMHVTTNAVQVLGGLGVTKASPVERMFRDAKTVQIYDGTSQIMNLIIANAITR